MRFAGFAALVLLAAAVRKYSFRTPDPAEAAHYINTVNRWDPIDPLCGINCKLLTGEPCNYYALSSKNRTVVHVDLLYYIDGSRGSNATAYTLRGPVPLDARQHQCLRGMIENPHAHWLPSYVRAYLEYLLRRSDVSEWRWHKHPRIVQLRSLVSRAVTAVGEAGYTLCRDWGVCAR